MTFANEYRKSKAMRLSHKIIVAIAIAIVTILIALIAADNAQYTKPITVNDKGIAMVDMGDHSVALDTVNENDQTIPSLKITGYNAPKTNDSIIPAELPHASVAHGEFNCTLSNHGVNFTVTQTTPCE
jgi:hypothetical protein